MESFKNQDRTERIVAYQEKHIPAALRSQKKVNAVIAAGLEHFYARKANIEGVENLPEAGPFLVIANHFNLDETPLLLATLKNYDAHVVGAKTIFSNPVSKIGLAAIRGITVPESLAHLSETEKAELLARIPNRYIRNRYEEVIDREAAGEVDQSGLIEFIRSSVALLSRGDVLVIYPEGLWLYDGEDGASRSHSLYKGLDGFNIIAEQYKKLTGEELPIIPVAISETDKTKQMQIGSPLKLSENDSGTSDTDWCMHHIAAMLPKENRGYYAKVQK